MLYSLNFLILEASTSNYSCEVNEWQCLSGNECVKAEYHCDGVADCKDKSDEVGCGRF